MRLIRGLSVQFVGISPNVTFASHMFRLNVACARFCFNLCRRHEISVRATRRRPDSVRRVAGTGRGFARSRL